MPVCASGKEKVSGRFVTVFSGRPRGWWEGDVQSQSAGDTGSPVQLTQGHTPDQTKKFFLTPFLCPATLEEAVAVFREALAVVEPAAADHYVETVRANLQEAERLLAERQ